MKQPFEGNIPCDALHRLPEWGVYVECPPAPNWLDLRGFWEHIEFDPNDGREELRLNFFDASPLPTMIALHLGDWVLSEAVRRYVGLAHQLNKIDLWIYNAPTATET